jgi:hypothetical protein
VASGENAVTFDSPGADLWLANPVEPQVSLLGRPSAVPVQATSAVPETVSGEGAANLIDGNLNSLAFPGSNHLDYTITLSAPTHVSGAAISWGSYGMGTGAVQSWTLYGRDGSYNAWQSLATGGAPNAGTTGLALNQRVTDLRIVADGPQNIGIYEVTVAGATALSGLSAIDNIGEVLWYSGYGPPALMFDGNDYGPSAYPADPFLDYSIPLPASTYVDGVRIVWGNFGTNDIYMSDWELYGQKANSTEWVSLARGGFPNAFDTVVNVQDSYATLRVAAASRVHLNWIGIYELQIFGSAISVSARAGDETEAGSLRRRGVADRARQIRYRFPSRP